MSMWTLKGSQGRRFSGCSTCSRAETPLTQTALLDQRGSFSERSFKAAIGSAIRHKWVLPTSGKNRSVLHSITKDGRERLEEMIKEGGEKHPQASETPE